MAKRWYSVSVLSNFEKKIAEKIRQAVTDQGLEEGSEEFEKRKKGYADREPMMRRARLTPDMPAWPAMCFYPMNKRREARANWLTQPFAERDRMMLEHGESGMQFAGRVTQLVTVGIGSGLDASIMGQLKATGQHKMLIKALEAAGLADRLRGNEQLTLFAPTDSAFRKLPMGTYALLLKPQNKSKLRSILKFHLVRGKHTQKQVSSKMHLKSLHGQMLKVIKGDHKVHIDQGVIQKADRDAANGVVHAIDKVLSPR